MNLTFLGRGAAFNPKEGNTSAYFIENKELFLIDCGEDIFSKLIKNNVLNNLTSINILITHTHSDHIGSIGTLIMYAKYTLHIPLHIIIPTKAKYLSYIENIIKSFGCTKDMYNYVEETKYDNKYQLFSKIKFIETEHSQNLPCYSIIFNTPEGLVYYSGDTKETNTLKNIITSHQKISKIYIDTTSANYPDNVHLYIGYLKEIIPEDLKNKVYCMHLNNQECYNLAIQYGFNVVKAKQK